MATTISNPQAGTFKRIKTQYITAAAGITLAVTAIVAGLTLLNDAPASTARGIAPVSVSDQVAGSFPLVQEMSHPQIDASFDPVASSSPQEWSRFVLPVVKAENLESDTGSYPLVQEQSHPVIPAVAPSDSTTDHGSYPLVQEMSHPR